MKENDSPSKAVSSSEYTQDYYQNACQGYSEYNSSKGRNLPARLEIPLRLANLGPGMHVVDIGCGRGEIITQITQRGALAWGGDYAIEAVKITSETIRDTIPDESRSRIMVLQFDAINLPIAENSVDIVFMLDVVEHLYPNQLAEALNEVKRILKPGGKLIIHTMPNLWYYRFGYPLFRMVQGLLGKALSTDPRERFPFHHLHVNEQTPARIFHSLQENQFHSKIWLETTVDYSYEKIKILRIGMEFLVKTFPFRYIFCNDIFAIAQKPNLG